MKLFISNPGGGGGATGTASITGGTATGLTGLGIRSTGAAFDLTLASSEALTAGRTLSFNVGDGNRTLTIPASGTVALLDTANNFTATQTVNSLSQIRSTGELQLQNSGASGGGALLYATSNFFTICRADLGNYTEVVRAVMNGGSIILGLWDGARFGNRIGFGASVIAVGGTHTTDVWLQRKSAATLQMGEDAAGVTNQMFTAANRITSDGVGANLTIAPGNGRGAAGGDLIFSHWTTGGAGVIGTLTTSMTINVNGITAAAKIIGSASTTSRATLNIPSGTAPTSPVDGDIWSDGSDLKVRLGGATYTLTKA